jgi:phosphatidylglycerol:prolipoprotein diacylglycerol transferase
VRRPLHERVVLLRVGRWTLVNFGLFAALGGFLAAWSLAARQLQAGMPVGSYLLALMLGVPILALVGSRLFALVVEEWRDFLRAPLETLTRTTLAWQGGFALVTAGVLALAAWHDLDPLAFIDTFAFVVPLGQAFGRVGCHTYGCCHGRPTRSRWAITVHNPDSKVVWGSGLRGVPLQPIQACSAAANLALAMVLALLALAGPFAAGTVSAVYLVLDGLKRLGLERFRGNPSPRYAGLTPYAWFAIVQVVVGLGVAWLSIGRAPVDFTGVGALAFAFASSARYLPAYLLAFAAMFALFGVHRGRPGSVRRLPGEETA